MNRRTDRGENVTFLVLHTRSVESCTYERLMLLITDQPREGNVFRRVSPSIHRGERGGVKVRYENCLHDKDPSDSTSPHPMIMSCLTRSLSEP